MTRSRFRFLTKSAGLLLWAFLSVFVAQGFAQQAQNLPGTESAPKVGAKAPLFDLEGFELKKQLDRGPILLLFYRGFF